MKKISRLVISALLFVSPLLSFAQNDDYGIIQGTYCPQISQRLIRGNRDSNTNGQVSQLQNFLKDHYDLSDQSFIVSGFFGRITQSYVVRFQQEQNLPAFGIVGTRTRNTIARVCSTNHVPPGTGAISISNISGPTELQVGQTGTWTINVNHNTNNLSYSVVWGDENNTVYTTNGAQPPLTQTSFGTFTHTYQNTGNYSPRFIVTNANGQSASATVSVVVSGSSGSNIIRGVGDREGSFLIQRINPNSVDGLWYQSYPVANNQGQPKTLYIGDDIGYACEGVSEKLTSIDYYGQKITFTKVTGARPFGGCPL